jgi:hypothetical protein
MPSANGTVTVTATTTTATTTENYTNMDKINQIFTKYSRTIQKPDAVLGSEYVKSYASPIRF